MANSIDKYALAGELLRAADARIPLTPLSQRHPDLTVSEAYDIQDTIRHIRVAHGGVLVGRKIGVTSEAIRAMLGIDHPDAGFILDSMVFRDAAIMPRERFIAPRVEGEVAFRLANGLSGGDVTSEDVLAACEAVIPVIELLDSRIAGWEIALVDTVADNASSAAVVLGEPCPIDAVDLAREVMHLTVDDLQVSGHGSAVMGHPANPVAWLTRLLHGRGEALHAGDVVLAGAWAAAVPVSAGSHIRVEFPRIGAVTASVD